MNKCFRANYSRARIPIRKRGQNTACWQFLHQRHLSLSKGKQCIEGVGGCLGSGVPADLSQPDQQKEVVDATSSPCCDSGERWKLASSLWGRGRWLGEGW